MKVYAAPEHIKLPNPDFTNYDRKAEGDKEADYIKCLADYAREVGYTGPLTGEVASFPFADGYARYMFCDDGRKSCLFHLALGDAWDYPYIERLTRKDIVENIQQRKRLAEIFGQK